MYEKVNVLTKEQLEQYFTLRILIEEDGDTEELILEIKKYLTWGAE